jgi:hypothetical protein
VKNADDEVVQEAESPEQLQVLKAKFRELCNPLTNVIIERHRFNTRVQEASEPVQNFITALKILADTCEYGTIKDSLIRDRIVCGVTSDTLRKQLLKERDLTLQKAIQMCQIHESAEKHTAQVSQQQEVNALYQAGKHGQNQTGGQQNTNAGSKPRMYCGHKHLHRNTTVRHLESNAQPARKCTILPKSARAAPTQSTLSVMKSLTRRQTCMQLHSFEAKMRYTAQRQSTNAVSS